MPKINIETRKSICEDATSGMSQKAIAKNIIYRDQEFSTH